jgi:hypothetical protein
MYIEALINHYRLKTVVSAGCCLVATSGFGHCLVAASDPSLLSSGFRNSLL